VLTSHCCIQQQHTFQDIRGLSPLKYELKLWLTLVTIPSLSDDKKYILRSAVLIRTNLWQLCVPGTALAQCSLSVFEHVPWFLSVLCRIKYVSYNIFFKSSGVKMWFLVVAWRLACATSYSTLPPIPS
jgi:hypothetical protein